MTVKNTIDQHSNVSNSSEGHMPKDHINVFTPIKIIHYDQMQRELNRTRFIKKIIPAFTIILFIALVLWPVLNNKEGSFTLAIDRLEQKDENAKLIKPRYVGIDKNNHPVNISAETAFRKDNNDKDYYLKNLLANLKMSDGTDIKILATSGIFDAKAQKIILDNSVDISTKSNFRLKTNQALFLINEKIATGKNGVTGETPFGNFKANNFHVNVDQEIIHLTGKVELYFNPDKNIKTNSKAVK